MFHKAAAAVARTHGMDYTPTASAPPVSTSSHARQPSDQKFQGSSGSKPSPAAQLYAQAMGSQGRPGGSGSGSGSGSGFGGSSKPAYVSAEEEKIALKRYHEAREAANRKQPSMFAEDAPPAAGSTAGPAHASGASVQGGSSFKPSQPPPFSDEPPPFEAPGTKNAFEQLSEKERLRQEYARRDAMAAGGASSKAQTPPPAAYTPPPPAAYSSPPPAAYTAPPPEPAPLTPAVYRSAQEEKEAMRRKFAARDQAMSGGSAASSLPSGAAPPRFNDAVPGYSPSPPAAAPPAPQRILTAAEEKAMLRAKYAAMEGGSKNGSAPNPPPPPFTPRTNGSDVQPLAPRSQYTQDDGRKPEYGYPGAPPPAGSQGFSPPAPSRYQE